MPTISAEIWGLMGLILALGLGFGISILIEILHLRGDIKPISSLVKDVDSFFRSSGLGKLVEGVAKRYSDSGHQSLSPEKAAERDAFIAIGRERGLLPPEAARLKELLEEDARNEFASGLLGVLAFAGIMIIIGAIISRLSRE